MITQVLSSNTTSSQISFSSSDNPDLEEDEIEINNLEVLKQNIIDFLNNTKDQTTIFVLKNGLKGIWLYFGNINYIDYLEFYNSSRKHFPLSQENYFLKIDKNRHFVTLDKKVHNSKGKEVCVVKGNFFVEYSNRHYKKTNQFYDKELAKILLEMKNNDTEVGRDQTNEIFWNNFFEKYLNQSDSISLTPQINPLTNYLDDSSNIEDFVKSLHDKFDNSSLSEENKEKAVISIMKKLPLDKTKKILSFLENRLKQRNEGIKNKQIYEIYDTLTVQKTLYYKK
jgi:hypothetical protein